MIVRIQLGQGRGFRKGHGKNRHVALAGAALLAPISLMAYVLGLWRLSSDVGVTRESGLGGLLSHWQVWIAAGVSLHIAAYVLNRYGRDGEMHLPRALMFRFAKQAQSSPAADPGANRSAKSAKAS